MGLGRVALREKWAPIVGAGTIQFRRELKPFQRFTLETRLVGWVGSRGIMEQRVLIGAEQKIATRALLVTGIVTAVAAASAGRIAGWSIGFFFAMLWGVIVGAYSTVYLAKSVVLWLGVKRDWSKPVKTAPGERDDLAGTPFKDMP